MLPEESFDVLVIGAGHAGTEAAVAAARLGARVGLVTSALETIGQMSCNPAIGGVAKGTVVREVDALGGIMGRATDLATLQFRMLNRSKGPAVWAPRAQCDRGLYRRAVRTLLERHEGLHTIQGTVARLLLEGEGGTARVAGVETLEGRRFAARAVVVTTGTFLRGRIHIGTTTSLSGGRAGEGAATHLAEQLERAGLEVARFKTGTPPRIDGRTVAFDVLERQDSELERFGYRWSHFWSAGTEGVGRAPESEAWSPAGEGSAPTGDGSMTVGGADGAILRSGAPGAGGASDGEAPPGGEAPPTPKVAPNDARAVTTSLVASSSSSGAAPTADGEPFPGSPAQLPCWITYLEEPGKTLIADHIGESAMYGGAIASRGPRYCPSVEDKIVKFPDAERHQVFLEPEGHDTREMYVNGLSTSLPAPVQLAVLRSIRGLERVRMTRAGYAIEYDYYPPTQLDATLQVRALPGLYFAGQINGTTGYEEAAGQGTVAGLNAALAVLGRPPLVLGRETSYLGVLVDDLVTRGVDEPYRLFTSRSEFRLTVRQDNALRRLAPFALALGLYDEGERAAVARRFAAEDEARRLAERTSVRPEQADPLLVASGTAPLAHGVKVVEVARRQGVALADLFAAAGVGSTLPADAVVSAELEIKYEGYFARERQAADRLRRMGEFAVPPDLPWPELRSLSFEARQKLASVRPQTLAQASRVPGVSPTDLQNLVLEVERRRRG